MGVEAYTNSAARGAMMGIGLFSLVAVGNITWSWLAGRKLTSQVSEWLGKSAKVEL